MQLIVFEGIDGSGKTTISNKVASIMKAHWSAEPYSHNYIKMIEDKSEVEKAYLFSADRYNHCNELSALLRDTHCIVDRYFYSNIVYQSVLGDLSKEWVARIQPPNLIRPDLVVHVRCDPSVAQKRCADKNEFWETSVLKELQDTYVDILYKSPIIVVDTSVKSVGESITECLELILARLTELPAQTITYEVELDDRT